MDYPRLLKMLRLPVAFLLLTCMASASWAQVQSGSTYRPELKMTLEDMGPEALARSADATDRAVAAMDLSQLHINTFNMGIVFGNIFSSGRASFPSSEGWRGNYWYDLYIALAIGSGPWQGNAQVHDSSRFMHGLSKIDWEPVDGARGSHFSNPPQLTSSYPTMATSDLPATWPTSGWPAPESVTEVWTGTDTWQKWERAGDRNAYCVFNDDYAGREGDGFSGPIGITVRKRTIAYSAMNLIFMQYEVTNTSAENLTGVYFGQVGDKGSPSTSQGNGSYLEYDEEHQLIYSVAVNYDPATGKHFWGGTSPTSESLPWVAMQVLESPTGSFRENNYDPDNPGTQYITEDPSPSPDPITLEDPVTFPYGPDNILTRVSLLEYGDRVTTDEATSYGAFTADYSVLESGHISNIWKDSGSGPVYKQTSADYQALYPGWEDASDPFHYSASGPFTMPSGSSFDIVMAFIGANTYEEMIENAILAEHTYNIQFAGPAPPLAPGSFEANGIAAGPGGKEYDSRVHAYPIYYAPSGNITLSWDSSVSLTNPDPSSGLYDFEGFRLFRSTDRGDSWGEIVTDSQGGYAGYVPYRQWDLVNDIMGDDGLSDTYLGDDTGLVGTFTDPAIMDGIEYWYAITSYDHGVFLAGEQALESLQSPIGSNPNSPSVIAVVAGSRPNGYTAGEASVTGAERLYADVPINSDATVTVNVVNDAALTGSNYRLTTTLDGDYGELSYTDVFGVTLENLTTGQTLFTSLLPDQEDYGSGLLPVAEGFQLTIDTDWNADPDPWNLIDTDFPDVIEEYSGYGMNYAAWRFQGSTLDYTDLTTLQTEFFPVEIRFSATTTQEGYTWTRGGYAWRGIGTFPGTVWDMTDPSSPRQVNMAWTVQSSRAAGDNDYAITSPAEEGTYRSYALILDSDYDAGASAFYPTITYTSGLLDALYETWLGVDADYLTSGQTLGEYLDGEVLEYYFRRPMSAGTTYEFSTTASAIEDSLVDLDDIKVVPNPYYIYADWDLSNNRRKIQFTNVPINSEIQIYTLAGELVAILDHHGDATAVAGGRQYNSNRVGTVDWNIWTYEFTEAAYGLYIYVVKTDDGETKVGKFAIIR